MMAGLILALSFWNLKKLLKILKFSKLFKLTVWQAWISSKDEKMIQKLSNIATKQKSAVKCWGSTTDGLFSIPDELFAKYQEIFPIIPPQHTISAAPATNLTYPMIFPPATSGKHIKNLSKAWNNIFFSQISTINLLNLPAYQDFVGFTFFDENYGNTAELL